MAGRQIKGLHYGDNVLDQWLQSRLQTLKSNVAEEMEGYKLYNVVPQLFAFIEDLTNWYIRLNRGRFWGEEITGDKIAAYSTLYEVLLELGSGDGTIHPVYFRTFIPVVRAFGRPCAEPRVGALV